MFHKRLMQEFRDNMKYVAGMVATQWLMLIANVFFMYTLAGFISSAADGTAKTADLQKIFIVLACVIAVRAVSTYVNSRLSFAASCNVKWSMKNSCVFRVHTENISPVRKRYRLVRRA